MEKTYFGQLPASLGALLPGAQGQQSSNRTQNTATRGFLMGSTDYSREQGNMFQSSSNYGAARPLGTGVQSGIGAYNRTRSGNDTSGASTHQNSTPFGTSIMSSGYGGNHPYNATSQSNNPLLNSGLTSSINIGTYLSSPTTVQQQQQNKILGGAAVLATVNNNNNHNNSSTNKPGDIFSSIGGANIRNGVGFSNLMQSAKQNNNYNTGQVFESHNNSLNNRDYTNNNASGPNPSLLASVAQPAHLGFDKRVNITSNSSSLSGNNAHFINQNLLNSNHPQQQQQLRAQIQLQNPHFQQPIMVNGRSMMGHPTNEEINPRLNQSTSTNGNNNNYHYSTEDKNTHHTGNNNNQGDNSGYYDDGKYEDIDYDDGDYSEGSYDDEVEQDNTPQNYIVNNNAQKRPRASNELSQQQQQYNMQVDTQSRRTGGKSMQVIQTVMGQNRRAGGGINAGINNRYYDPNEGGDFDENGNPKRNRPNHYNGNNTEMVSLAQQNSSMDPGTPVSSNGSPFPGAGGNIIVGIGNVGAPQQQRQNARDKDQTQTIGGDILLAELEQFKESTGTYLSNYNVRDLIERVKAVLLRDGLKQKDLAQYVGISGSTLSPLLKHKYMHTKPQHIALLIHWVLTRDREFLKILSSRLKLLGITTGVITERVGITEEEWEKFSAMTHAVGKDRNVIDPILTQLVQESSASRMDGGGELTLNRTGTDQHNNGSGDSFSGQNASTLAGVSESDELQEYDFSRFDQSKKEMVQKAFPSLTPMLLYSILRIIGDLSIRK